MVHLFNYRKNYETLPLMFFPGKIADEESLFLNLKIFSCKNRPVAAICAHVPLIGRRSLNLLVPLLIWVVQSEKFGWISPKSGECKGGKLMDWKQFWRGRRPSHLCWDPTHFQFLSDKTRFFYLARTFHGSMKTKGKGTQKKAEKYGDRPSPPLRDPTHLYPYIHSDQALWAWHDSTIDFEDFGFLCQGKLNSILRKFSLKSLCHMYFLPASLNYKLTCKKNIFK